MMAEVTIDTPVNIETDGEKDGHLRGFSNANCDDQNSVAKRGSRYRSVSSGSCHDLCKHGFKSDSETMVRRSLVRRNTLDSTRKTAKTYEVIKKEIPESSKKVNISLRRQTSSPAEMKYASEKHSRVPEPKTPSLAATQRLRRRHSDIIIPKKSEPLYKRFSGRSGQTNSEKKVNKETENSKIEKKKILGRERFSLSSMPTTKRILSTQSEYIKKLKKVPSTLKNRKQIKEVEGKYGPSSEYVIEKTPYVIGLAKRGTFASSKFLEKEGLGNVECTVKASHSPPTENTDKSLSSLKSQSSTSSSPEAMQSDDSAFDIVNSESEYSTTDLEVENLRTPRIQVLSLEDKDWPSSHKLQFRRGNVIDVQLEDISPSRLKFRHQEALDENGISDTEFISLRRMSSDGVLYETNSETEKVTLKHLQDMEAKEETWGLVNDVIEETANRLVRSRKSKVKALVGAFEAVLCRQDIKSEEMNPT